MATDENPIIRARARQPIDVKMATFDAVHGGEDGEQDLIEALTLIDGDERIELIVALGEAKGSQGPAVLRQLLDSPASDDDRYAALMSLAKRERVTASDALTEWLKRGNDHEKAAAMIGLAAVGDDRAWDLTLAYLDRLVIQRKKPLFAPPIRALPSASRPAMAICYLAQHLQSQREQRVPRLAGYLRQHWQELNSAEHTWLSDQWPTVAPGGPAPHDLELPDPKRLVRWATTPLLDPTY